MAKKDEVKNAKNGGEPISEGGLLRRIVQSQKNQVAPAQNKNDANRKSKKGVSGSGRTNFESYKGPGRGADDVIKAIERDADDDQKRYPTVAEKLSGKAPVKVSKGVRKLTSNAKASKDEIEREISDFPAGKKSQKRAPLPGEEITLDINGNIIQQHQKAKKVPRALNDDVPGDNQLHDTDMLHGNIHDANTLHSNLHNANGLDANPHDDIHDGGRNLHDVGYVMGKSPFQDLPSTGTLSNNIQQQPRSMLKSTSPTRAKTSAAPPLPPKSKAVGTNKAGRARFILPESDLIALLDDGMSTSAIARAYGISIRAVQKRVATLKVRDQEANMILTAPDGTRILNTPEQIAAINKFALEGILDKRYSIGVKMGLMTRVERHNEFQLRFQQLAYSIREVQEFQRTVLDVLDEVEPSLRAEVLRRLKERKAAKAAVTM